MNLRRLVGVVLFIFLVVGFVSASQVISNPRISASFIGDSYVRTNPSVGGAFSGSAGIFDVGFDDSMCKEGQDFIIQIDPMGCTPAVVRSDLLEEQDVPVFCKLRAIKVNPIIDISSIYSIDLKGDYGRDVKTVGFYPSRDALGKNKKLNNLMWDDIGYAVIFLRKNPNESAMPSFVEGNLTARIRYNLENSFGLRYHTFYLPTISDRDFESKMGQYAFFNKMGYLRAEGITDNSASIVIYSGRYKSPFGKSREGVRERQKIGSYTLGVGQTTGTVYLPGLGCYSGVKFKLDGVELPDTYARLSINSEEYDLRRGEKFLKDRCSVLYADKNGISDKVRISCRADDGIKLFDLNVNPGIKLSIDGEVKDVKVGDKVADTNDGGIYLAYVNTADGSINPSKLIAVFVRNGKIESGSLSDSEVLAASYVFRNYGEGSTLTDFLGGEALKLGMRTFNKDQIKVVEYGKESVPFSDGPNIKIVGFGGAQNYPLDDEIQANYSLALDSYDEVINNFRQEKYPEDRITTLAEDAAYDKILLAKGLNQFSDMKFFCDDFKENFPDSMKDVSICDDFRHLANTEVSSSDVLIDGEYWRLDLERVVQPSYEDYGAKIFVKGLEEGPRAFKMMKGQVVQLDNGDSIKLISVSQDSARFEFYLHSRSVGRTVSDYVFSRDSTLSVGDADSFGSKYSFSLVDTNVKKVAKVSIIPVTNHLKSNATFQFKIGIEKRNIQLSPEKTKQRIEKLNKTIKGFEKISNNLETVVSGMKKTCLATGVVLTAKNLVTGANGKTIARQEVMRGEGGWVEECADSEYQGVKYSSPEKCLLANSDKIDEEVQQIVSEMNKQNNAIKELEKKYLKKGGLFKDDVFDEDNFSISYAKNLSWKISSSGIQDLEKDGKNVDLDKIKNILNEEGYKQGIYSVEDLKDVELYLQLYQKYGGENYKDRLFTALNKIEVNAEHYNLYVDAEEKSKKRLGVEGMVPQVIASSKDAKRGVYQGYKSPSSGLGHIRGGVPLQSILYNNNLYYVTLEETSFNSQEYRIVKVYDESGFEVSKDVEDKIKSSYSSFIEYDEKSYKNPYLSTPKVRYYETEPYKGMPAVVPFDTRNGWYVYVRHTVPALGSSTRGYDESGRVNSFWLCNIGPNRMEDFSEGRDGDDVCELINVQTGQSYSSFPGLSKTKSSRLIDDAVKAIIKATRAYKPGVRRVYIGGRGVEVGSPMVNQLSTTCEDVMSPKDCQILFNVCDPVICPPSRCDFGGAYPVQDVIQSGIVGSIALCLPNWKEGIYVPVCLTGVQAGVDSFTSVLKAYRDCLNQNLKTGETVGVCDEINSVYMCEFFWRQGLPLANIAIPKIIGKLSGENVRGGGEYLRIQSAFENVKDSVNYFTQSYALNAFSAFKARSQGEVGSAVCKNFISISYPKGQGFLNVLTEADSPAQFSGSFDEIPFTTATNPPISHYKVYYHIYAGKDRGAYYKVYLRGGSSSYYGDNFLGRVVGSGYIGRGDYATKTADFTAPSGYKELCIVVNNDERCGFKEVSTSFAKNYIKDKFVQKELNRTDIKTEKACVSGTASVYSLLNPNVQEGVGDLLSPEVYNRGITRICASENPGKGNDPHYPGPDQRWVEVGYCGNENVKCWLDSQSVENSLEYEKDMEDSLDSLSKRILENLEREGGYLNVSSFEKEADDIEKTKSPYERLRKIEVVLKKVFRNNEKAYLFFKEGEAYGEIAQSKFVPPEPTSEGKKPGEKPGETTEGEVAESIWNIINEPDFKSPIFQMGIGWSLDLCFEYFEGEWHWTDSCKEVKQGYSYRTGDSTIASGYQLDDSVDKLWYKPSSHYVKTSLSSFKGDIVKGLEGKNYSAGLEYLSNKINSTKRLNSLKTSSVKKDEDEIFNYFKGQNIYFVYKDGEWKWALEKLSVEDKEWKSVGDLSSFEKEVSQFSGEAYPPSIYTSISKLSDSGKELVSLMNDLDFSQGMVVLFEYGVIGEFSTGKEKVVSSSTEEISYEELSASRKKVLDFTKELEGHYAFIGDAGCYDAAVYVYKQLGFDTGRCIYADRKGRIYNVDGSRLEIGEDKAPNSNYPLYQVALNPDSCAISKEKGSFVDLTNQEKLDLLRPGDLISYVYSPGAPHNAIFIEWVDRANNKARLFDWNGERIKPGFKNKHGEVCEGDKIKDGAYCKTYEFYEATLDDDKHPVYMIWVPTKEDLDFNSWKGEMDGDSEVSSQVPENKYVNFPLGKIWTLDEAIKVSQKFDTRDFYYSNPSFKQFIESLHDSGTINDVEYFLFRTDWSQVSKSGSDLQNLLKDIRVNDKHWGINDLVLNNFNDAEKSLFRSRADCESCGDGWNSVCDEKECFVLGIYNGKGCDFEHRTAWIGGKCTTKEKSSETSSESLSSGLRCNSPTQCQRVLGKQILSLLKENGFDDIEQDYFKKTYNLNSFSCAILAVARAESNVQFCEKPYDENKDPLYCEGNPDEVLREKDSGRDWGVMQLNEKYNSGDNLTKFDENVLAAAEKLKKSLLSAKPRHYSCTGKTYDGFDYALRDYNGWNTDCTKGNENYVEDVNNYIDWVLKNFPECKPA